MDAQSRLPHDGPSTAQWCPYNILRELMAYLSEKDTAMCSLVCHGWLFACRERLYYKPYIRPSATRPSIQYRASLLGRTLCTSPHLQSFVRHLIIVPLGIPNDNTYTWIPNHFSLVRVRRFELWQRENGESFRDIVSSALPLPSVEYVSIRGKIKKYSPTSMQRVLEMFPNADSFVLDLDGMQDYSPRTQHHRVMRRLSLIACHVPAHLFVPYTSSLTRLDIETRISTDEKLLAMTIISMTHLVTLTISFPAESTFLDYVVPQLPHLRVLYCARDSYSSTLLRELPGQIHTLWLQACRWDKFDVAAIDRTIQRSRAQNTSLRELCLDFGFRSGSYYDEIQSVRASCADSSIHFSYHSHKTNHLVDLI